MFNYPGTRFVSLVPVAIEGLIGHKGWVRRMGYGQLGLPSFSRWQLNGRGAYDLRFFHLV